MLNEKMISLLPFETERLIIKPTSIDDIELILKMDKQEDTQRYLGGIKNKTREERIAFLEKKNSKFKDGHAGSLTVYLKDGTPIGFTGLSINEDNNNASISYIFDSDYTGKGYASEACRKLLSIGFDELGLNKIYADVISDNNRSKVLLERLGFTLEGVRREAAYIKNTNEYKDFLDYGLLKKEYKK